MQEFEIKYVDVHAFPGDRSATAKFDVLVSGSTNSGDGRKSPGILAATVYLPTGSEEEQVQRQLANLLEGVARQLKTASPGTKGLEEVVGDAK